MVFSQWTAFPEANCQNLLTALNSGSTLLLTNLRIIWEFAHPAGHRRDRDWRGCAFLSDMTNANTYVRLLRHLGIALIFAPEPFTTPFGVACILAARHLSKRNEASVNNRLREMVQSYLAHTNRFTNQVESEARAPATARRRNLSKEHPVLGQITGSRSFEAKSSVRQGKCAIQDGRANQTTNKQSLSQRCKYADGPVYASLGIPKVIHHTINTEWLSRRYECGNSTVVHSAWATTCSAVEAMTHHSININLLSQHGTTGNFEQTKAMPHNMSMALLRQRHGPTASHTTFFRALQTSNHYYDMLSRGSVVGGY